MKLTYRWLREHLDTERTPQELAERLTMIGLEIESRADLRQGLAGVRTGCLEEVVKHPKADRLTLCRVRMGDRMLSIVCGARNHKVGDMVAVALPGTTLVNGMTIQQTTIRGVASSGMLCSLKELGLAENSDGVLILPAGTPEDVELAMVLGRDDELFEINVTPNRGDCLGVRGIARELAAAFDEPLLPLATPSFPVRPGPAGVTVNVTDREGCAVYYGREVFGVRVGPSPDWLVQRLEWVGLRSINNVVDATNYVMFELGQPLHAFDRARLQPPVVVRRARDGETLAALNGVEYRLDGTMTVIADRNVPLALAGIMGGESSGVVEGTTDLFLESAWFEPVPVARTGRRLGVVSDSRYRFERGTDRGGVAAALERLTALVVQLAGGEAGPVVVGDHVREVVPVSIPFRPSRVERLSGVAMEPALVRGILERLGCLWQPAADGSGAGTVVPPGWRHDLHCEEDLVEEVVRIYGYDRVPVSAPLVALAVPPATAGSQLRERAREALVGLGYFEAIHFVFVNPSVQQQFAPDQPAVALLNPLSEEQSALRTTLVPGLVEAAVRNLRRGNTVVRLCEFGRVFLPQPDGRVVERERCAGVIAGVVQDRAWYASARQADVFDLKGDLETLGAQLQRGGWQFHAGVADAGRLSFLHPGRQACIGPAGGPQLGWMGQLHPVVQESFDVAVPLMLFELEFPETGTTAPVTMPTWSSFPAVARDFAFLVAGDVPVGAMLEAIREVDPVLIRRVTLFDVYAGTGVPAGTRSLGFEVLLQADDRTLTEEESQAVARQVVAQMQERFAAVLRGEADAGA